MIRKCKLQKEYNSCEFYNSENMNCNNDRSCCFQFEVEQPVKYERGERWYEKYTDPEKREKHRRIWQCYRKTDNEMDRVIRQALFEIEAIANLPSRFEIVDIDYSLLGITMTYKNAGKCEVQVQEILNKLADSTRMANK